MNFNRIQSTIYSSNVICCLLNMKYVVMLLYTTRTSAFKTIYCINFQMHSIHKHWCWNDKVSLLLYFPFSVQNRLNDVHVTMSLYEWKLLVLLPEGMQHEYCGAESVLRKKHSTMNGLNEFLITDWSVEHRFSIRKKRAFIRTKDSWMEKSGQFKTAIRISEQGTKK